MSNWKGAAAVCINDQSEVLMILQGPPDEEKKWGLPAGPPEGDETLEQSCIREFAEVTGLEARILRHAGIKKDSYDNADVAVELHYFLVEVVGGQLAVPEEDPWIREIVWQPVAKLDGLDLADPGEAELISSLLEN
ncbi:DNA mismatch repair protein MutT [Planococcus salinarum]|uniref:DNA mismatch repair protein MutT n=2 Tax=Planococcus salinarum TaxID=622695 RepID=A0ABX3D1P8_9BACL|nr:NUDIX hydrolase [Planococcus salinarum]OHX51842.1 DNA mismatch repair protein MutT [Planococcus salinarum]TAA72660.1 NUDIX hydrolase [Planococcus salinarum]